MLKKKNLSLSFISFFVGLFLTGCQINSPALPEDTIDKLELVPDTNSERTVTESGSFSTVDFNSEIVATQPWNLAFVIKEERYEDSPEDGFWRTMWRGAEKAGQDFGVNLDLAYVTESCNSEAQCEEEQIKLVLKLLEENNMDGMIISAKDADRLVPITEKVIASGIPVIAVDSIVNTDQILSFVTVNNFEAGKQMGEWLVSQLEEDSNVVILEGEIDQQNARDRRNGFFAGLQTGSVNILDSKSARWYEDVAAEITADWLQDFSDIDAILAANDSMALGALTAVKEADRDQILVTGYDAIGDAIASIHSNDLAATIDQVPGLQARAAVQMMVRHLETGETFPPQVLIPDVKLITQSNVDDYIQERE